MKNYDDLLIPFNYVDDEKWPSEYLPENDFKCNGNCFNCPYRRPCEKGIIKPAFPAVSDLDFSEYFS